MQPPDFNPSCTVKGELPPWEIARAFAFHTAINTLSEQLGEPASKLLGKPLAEYIAEHVTLQGGGHPEPRAVQKVVARCSQPDWYPGQRTAARKGAGRPPVFTDRLGVQACGIKGDGQGLLVCVCVSACVFVENNLSEAKKPKFHQTCSFYNEK